MKIEVLDHGYVDFVETWGHGQYAHSREYPGGHMVTERDMEAGIIEAARQSTQGSFRGWDQDLKLLRHLFRNRPQHATPFEFAGLVVEVQAPIFVFREWHRHRTQSFNEMSARYAPLPDLYYTPDARGIAERMALAASSKNKQAQATVGATDLTLIAELFVEQLKGSYAYSEAEYQQYLAWGIPKELARLVMPVGHYSRMRACVNLRNWLAFISLRDEEGVQWETREYAKAAGQIIADIFPHTWALYEELRADTKEAWRLWDEAQKCCLCQTYADYCPVHP